MDERGISADVVGYAPVSGLQLYFEIYGSGVPLLLLHGGLGSTKSFAPIVSSLAARRRVIAADLLGYSLGGEVALLAAIRYPKMVRKLVLISAAFRRDGWHREVLAMPILAVVGDDDAVACGGARADNAQFEGARGRRRARRDPGSSEKLVNLTLILV